MIDRYRLRHCKQHITPALTRHRRNIDTACRLFLCPDERIYGSTGISRCKHVLLEVLVRTDLIIPSHKYIESRVSPKLSIPRYKRFLATSRSRYTSIVRIYPDVLNQTNPSSRATPACIFLASEKAPTYIRRSCSRGSLTGGDDDGSDERYFR